MKFILKIHESEEGRVAAVCDNDLLGKIFKEDELVLNIDRKFFGNQPTEINRIKHALKTVDTANIVGNEIVKELLDSKNTFLLRNKRNQRDCTCPVFQDIVSA